MSALGPYLDLQDETAAHLALHATLAPVPMVTETLGNVTSRLNEALVKGALKENSSGKAGLAILILTPKGRGLESTRSVSSQSVIVRVALFCRPIINDSAQGLQLAPLAAQFAIHQQMLSWNRGAGQTGLFVQLTDWDSRENQNGEISYFSDFDVPLILSL